ncbi:MAG: hypothetical protein A2381_16685 [Bdellovibrionales bacterium RIFOXYB1_FULL_37_110]|nr:MAG: hypothetical protein A2181_07690 [Bdellovibrionales bacterium RIFOXYA1_FULL_38_20]OFZ50035.1 MAG: hypothetical protein A2417_18520 [Bdellovibrionales bacterium RIFOXYC1_FULL_37_79]OFZ59941.1 MAG: hypothetical protein A2381_16685 [Bdellovibrionales bacterium RIFOXYB1_FULL_37_110]OFZ63912.1 MAG: hypothetical protein A2577_05875 [Bdellovibrionales bacterium RIFOXYD1_FULL_36_51]
MGGGSRFLSLVTDSKKEITKKDDIKILNKTISYFHNNNEQNRMQYYKFVDSVVPIGSGATEAACKVLVKERMCKSGMRWKQEGAKIILLTRSLRQTKDRWGQFWSKVNQYGFNDGGIVHYLRVTPYFIGIGKLSCAKTYSKI